MQLLDRINRTGTTVVVATHDEVLVDKMRRRVLELSNGVMVRDQARGVYGFDGSRSARRPTPPWEVPADMAVSVDYVVRETASNLWRNRLMTIAAILTVAVSLSLVGAALLLRQGSANATGTLERGTNVTVWMEPNANAAGDRGRPHPAGPAQLRRAALPVLEQGQELRRGPQAPVVGRLPGHHRGGDADLVLVHPGRPRRRGPGRADLQRVTRGCKTVTEPQQTIKNEETFINISKWACLASPSS